MAASSSDLITEVGSPGTATTLAAPGHTIGGSSFTVVSTTNWPTTTGAIFAIDTLDISTGLRVPGSYTEWQAVVSSSTSLTSAVLRYGTDQNYPAGVTTRVYIPVASSRENRLAQGISVGHSQLTGNHQFTTNYDPSNPTLETQKWVGVSSAVNEVTTTNAVTGNAPGLAATGDDTNINLSANGKGTGGFIYKNPYKFSVYRSTSFNSANGAFAKIQFDIELYDTGSNYDNTTNYRFTAPIAGFYEFTAKSVAGGNTSGIIIYMAIYKNGAELHRGPTATSATTVVSASVNPPPIQLAATDYIEVFLFASSTIGMAGDAGISTWFGGKLISTN